MMILSIATVGVAASPKSVLRRALQFLHCCIAGSKYKAILGVVFRISLTSDQSVLQLVSNFSSHSSGRMLRQAEFLESMFGDTRRMERQGLWLSGGKNLTNRTRVAIAWSVGPS